MTGCSIGTIAARTNRVRATTAAARWCSAILQLGLLLSPRWFRRLSHPLLLLNCFTVFQSWAAIAHAQAPESAWRSLRAPFGVEQLVQQAG
jgi:hypothetical protein